MKGFNSVQEYLGDAIKSSLRICSFENDNQNLVSNSQRPEIADFQSNICFALSKKCGVAPLEVANKIVNNLSAEVKKYFDVTIVQPAFINFKFTEQGLMEIANNLLSDPNYGINSTMGAGKTIVLDYGGANVAKELHMGHLRSPIIGEALRRLYKLFGYDTIGDVHLGDWGLQMGLVMAMLEEKGLLKYYFGETNVKPEITLEFLNENYPIASKRSKTDPEFKVKAETLTLKLQKLEEPYYTIFKDIRAVSVEAIKRNYETLNCTFDLWYGESDAYKYIEKTVNTFIEKGLTKESDGATIVEVKREGEHIPIPKKNPDDPNERQLYKNPMPPVIIKKHNGGDLYATTDIATIMQRVEDFKNLTEIVYIVDKRQANHFEGIFRAAKMACIAPENLKLTHIGYGTMNGRDGKPFKTRDGDSIKLEDIINLVKSKAEEKLKQNGTSIEGKDLALEIGVSAMKFGDLSNDVSRDYVFDLESFLSFEGKTGPYLQYTAVRIASILNKAGEFEEKISTSSQLEKDIILEILKLINAYSTALKELSPSIICNALYNLASAYSTFYNNTKVLSEPDKGTRDSYLSLSKLVLDKLKQGLDILAIDVPEKM